MNRHYIIPNRKGIASIAIVVGFVLFSLFSIASVTLLKDTKQTIKSKAAETCGSEKCDGGVGGCVEPKSPPINGLTCCGANTGPQKLSYAYWSVTGCEDVTPPPAKESSPPPVSPPSCSGTCAQGEKPDNGSGSCIKESGINTGQYCTCDRKNDSPVSFPAYDSGRFDVCPKPTAAPVGVNQSGGSCGDIAANSCSGGFCCGDCRIIIPEANYNCLVPKETYDEAISKLPPSITPVKCTASGSWTIENNCYRCNYSGEINPSRISEGECPISTPYPTEEINCNGSTGPTLIGGICYRCQNGSLTNPPEINTSECSSLPPPSECVFQNLRDCLDECKKTCIKDGCENGPGSYKCGDAPIREVETPVPIVPLDPECIRRQKWSVPCKLYVSV